MASVREYFETDFGHSLRVKVTIPLRCGSTEAIVVYDFASLSAFFVLYVPREDENLEYFLDLLSEIEHGPTQVNVEGQVFLPLAREFPGRLRVENMPEFEVLGQYFGDTEWMSTKSIPATSRIFIYSETDLNSDQITFLKARARAQKLELQFRSQTFVRERTKYEPPLAFISHDSRDKDIANRIAVALQGMRCTVWYDDFCLRVGVNLRESIEKGLKECRKCILILSSNFISNKGWTKMEFDSIFTRQILEKEKLVLPVWYRVGVKEVYDYSPSLVNVYALDWEKLGEDEVYRQLYSTIINE